MDVNEIFQTRSILLKFSSNPVYLSMSKHFPIHGISPQVLASPG